jgi:hypothetical protein
LPGVIGATHEVTVLDANRGRAVDAAVSGRIDNPTIDLHVIATDLGGEGRSDRAGRKRA